MLARHQHYIQLVVCKTALVPNGRRGYTGDSIPSNVQVNINLRRTSLSWKACNDGDIRDFSPIEPSQVVRTAAGSANNVLHGLELYVVTRLAATERLQTVVWCVLEDVEGIRNVQYTVHAVRCHCLGNVACAAAVAFDAFFLVHLREAGHECHVVDFDRVVDDLQDGFVIVSPEVFTNSRRHPVQMESSVGHRQLLPQVGALDPSGKVYYLLAVEVDDAEVFAFLDLERIAVSSGNDMSLES